MSCRYARPETATSRRGFLNKRPSRFLIADLCFTSPRRGEVDLLAKRASRVRGIGILISSSVTPSPNPLPAGERELSGGAERGVVASGERRVIRVVPNLGRHGRACPGHPDSIARCPRNRDARHKAGHDELTPQADAAGSIPRRRRFASSRPGRAIANAARACRPRSGRGKAGCGAVRWRIRAPRPADARQMRRA